MPAWNARKAVISNALTGERAPASAGNLESGFQTVAGGLVGEDLPRFFGNDTAGLERRQTRAGIRTGGARGLAIEKSETKRARSRPTGVWQGAGRSAGMQCRCPGAEAAGKSHPRPLLRYVGTGQRPLRQSRESIA